jgi:hypothetical protein
MRGRTLAPEVIEEFEERRRQQAGESSDESGDAE